MPVPNRPQITNLPKLPVRPKFVQDEIMDVRLLARFHDSIAEFSKEFHTKFLTIKSNYISSPLGAWLLLALAAGGNSAAYYSAEREKLEQALSPNQPEPLSLEEAYKLANLLLATAPDQIKVDSAAWFSKKFISGETPAAQRAHIWANNISKVIHKPVGMQIPSQDELNNWVDDVTLGIIKEFPLEVSGDTKAILATILATKVAWDDDFDVVMAEATKFPVNSSFKANKVLISSRESEHPKQLIKDENGEIFAIISVPAAHREINAIAVIAINKKLSKERVLEVAENFFSGQTEYEPVEPAHLIEEGKRTAKLGSTVKVETITATKGSRTAILPAWSAERIQSNGTNAMFDLLELLPIYDAALAMGLEPETNDTVKSVQSARAKFTSTGFEVAAVSVLEVLIGSMPPNVLQKGKKHRTTIWFDHAFAVVAGAVGSPHQDVMWHRLPVFSAWIVEADEAE